MVRRTQSCTRRRRHRRSVARSWPASSAAAPTTRTSPPEAVKLPLCPWTLERGTLDNRHGPPAMHPRDPLSRGEADMKRRDFVIVGSGVLGLGLTGSWARPALAQLGDILGAPKTLIDRAIEAR